MKTKTKVVVGKIIYDILLFLMFFLITVTLFSSNKLGIPYKVFTVESGSMKPTLNVGDLILTKTQSEYSIGDIVTFDGGSDNGKRIIITHRIVGEEDIQNVKFFVTKGDFNSVEDVNKLSKESIIGKLTFKVPLIGYVITFARTVLGFIILLVIPSTIIIYEEIKNIRNVSMQKRKDKNMEK